MNASKLKEFKEAFVKCFSGFTTFADAYQQYVQGKDNYKQKSPERMPELNVMVTVASELNYKRESSERMHRLLDEWVNGEATAVLTASALSHN